MSHYDTWKTTDDRTGADGSLERAPCAFWYEIDDEGWSRSCFCNVPYEDHNDEALGHAFEMPEPEERDY